jgi:hypothetical protein
MADTDIRCSSDVQMSDSSQMVRWGRATPSDRVGPSYLTDIPEDINRTEVCEDLIMPFSGAKRAV